MPNSNVTLFGQTNFRNQKVRFGIKVDDRRRHMYVIGKTGMGKTTMLENMVISDIVAGNGLGFVDPHGDSAEKLLDFIPKERINDVVYFNPADIDYPIAFNPLEQVTTEYRHLIASGLMGVFKKIWPDVWSARMEYILNNALLTLLEFPDSTVLGVMRLLSDKDYRKKLVEKLRDPVVKGFWVNEFARYAQKFETEATAAIQNKIGQFVANPLVRNILGQPRSALNLRKAMDTKKILIFNLAKGKIGEDNSALLGSMIITKLQLAAMSRVEIPEEDRKDFYLYVDEFQNFATDSFANILSEARKYRLCLTLAHQYIGQLTHDSNTKVRDAVFGNVGTIVTFRVGAEDAEFLEKELLPEFAATDIVNLPKANVYVKLMIDGVSSRPFSAQGLLPVTQPKESHRDLIIENSRNNYAVPIALVEEKIAKEWLKDDDESIRSASPNLPLRPRSEASQRDEQLQRPLGYGVERTRWADREQKTQSFAKRKQDGVDKSGINAPKPPPIPSRPESSVQTPRAKPKINTENLKEAISRALTKDKQENPGEQDSN